MDKGMEFFFELLLFAILTIGITAFLGVFVHAIGKGIFGGKRKNEYREFFQRIQQGFRQVGGREEH